MRVLGLGTERIHCAQERRLRVAAAALAALAVVAPTRPAAAEVLTGAKLLTLCRSEEPLHQGLCHGYFRGHAEVHGFYAALGQGPPLYCIPGDVTLADMERTAFRWMDRHLQHSDEPASVLIMQALREDFPCVPGGAPPGAAPPSGDTDE